MYSPIVDSDLKKGAISVTAIMIVISTAVTGLSMTISVDIVTDALDRQQHAGDIDWFENTIAADTADLCKSDQSDLWSPATTNYTREIAGLENIELELESDTLSTYNNRWKYILDFGDEEEEIYFDNERRVVGSLDCDDDSDALSFKGMGSGDSVSLDSVPHNYRLNSDSEGEVEIQIYEEGE